MGFGSRGFIRDLSKRLLLSSIAIEAVVYPRVWLINLKGGLEERGFVTEMAYYQATRQRYK